MQRLPFLQVSHLSLHLPLLGPQVCELCLHVLHLSSQAFLCALQDQQQASVGIRAAAAGPLLARATSLSSTARPVPLTLLFTAMLLSAASALAALHVCRCSRSLTTSSSNASAPAMVSVASESRGIHRAYDDSNEPATGLSLDLLWMEEG